MLRYFAIGCLLLALPGCGGCLVDTSPSGTDPAVRAYPEDVEAGSPSDEPDPTIPYSNPLAAEQIAEGWISLFDGHTLYGWTSQNNEVNWSVEDGAITADAGPIGLLTTNVPFADFEFHCQFRMSEGGNSGVFLRTVLNPQDVKTDCYELNIADTHPQGFTTGAIVGHAATAEPIPGSGDWKTFDVRVEGPRIVVQLDGEEVLDYTDESAARWVGRIGLQKNEGRIEFKDVLVRPLAMQSLFNGEDLAGWREVPGSQSEFTVEDEAIHVVNGQGFLETEETYADFIFQAESITHGDELNSGYFFRAIPGTEEAPSNGYEVQIHNGIGDGDPTRPANAGTGAIFRRTEARRVVSKDHEWFTTTLIAHGDHIAVWVNGYQVTDWTDERAPDENPRAGRRLEAGHISLQGHDPTTDLSFRSLKIALLPPE